MSWSASISGEFHQVVKDLRNLQITGDQRAADLGHVETAKEMALCAVDKERDSKVTFSVSLYGHAGTEDSYNVGANVSISRKA